VDEQRPADAGADHVRLDVDREDLAGAFRRVVVP
jgi:hypothetical protein